MIRKAILVVACVLPLTAHAAGGASTQDAGTGGDFRPVQVSDLSRHVGKQVRISLPRGVVREGTLVEALPNMVTVSRRYGRGDMKYDVLAKQIEKAEVQD